MKHLFCIFILIFATQSSADISPKYGDYVAEKCHWMSCTSLKLSKAEITRIYRSDKLSDNSETTDNYIFKDNRIKTIHTKEKYYYFTNPIKNKPNCGFYLADEKLYQKCDGTRECIINEAFHYNPKEDGKYPCRTSSQEPEKSSESDQKASIIPKTCPETIKNLKDVSFTLQIWVTADAQGKVAKMLKGTGSDNNDIAILKEFKACKYSPRTLDGKNISSWLILHVLKRNGKLSIH